jgi:hypothetical protein
MTTKDEEPGSWATLGPWWFEANVEVKVPDMYAFPTKDIEKGDLWFRIAISISFDDGDGEHGMAGELTTPWLYSVNEAAKQAKLLRGMALSWVEYSDDTDEYEPHEGPMKFDEIIDHSVERFCRAMPGVS